MPATIIASWTDMLKHCRRPSARAAPDTASRTDRSGWPTPVFHVHNQFVRSRTSSHSVEDRLSRFPGCCAARAILVSSGVVLMLFA
ncbi:hypothetical protein Aduo_004693 [Ancylostoma duodenale]